MLHLKERERVAETFGQRIFSLGIVVLLNFGSKCCTGGTHYVSPPHNIIIETGGVALLFGYVESQTEIYQGQNWSLAMP